MKHLTAQYFLNHLLEAKELRLQVKAIANAGYEVIYAHSRLGLRTPYLSKKWWDAIGIIIDECKSNGMEFAIWDEDFYPSGTAGNRIIWEHPELHARCLEFTVFEALAGTQVEKLFPVEASVYRCFAVHDGKIEDITEYCGSLATGYTRYIHSHAYSHVAKIGTPHWRSSKKQRGFGILWDSPWDCTVIAVQICIARCTHNTDILNPKTAEKIIQSTHDEYVKHFGKIHHASFMDEPGPGATWHEKYGGFPWTERFPEEFAKEHGYELSPQMAHLICDVDASSPRIRHHYRQTQMRLQCENYLEPVRKWCAGHDMLSIGHLMRTESFVMAAYWPNELRCYKYLDIPCCDPLGATVAWRDACAYHVGVKMVSSAARHFCKEQAGSDMMAVVGNESCLRDSKFIMDYHLVLGVTYFNIDGLHYSYDGARKDDAPTSYFYQHTEWPLMSELLGHAHRTASLLASGQPLRNLAMLYPSATMYCVPQDSEFEERYHRIADSLLSEQKDFDLIDELTLAEKIDAGLEDFISVYPCFIVAETKYIEPGTAECLERYVTGGGKLQVIGPVPRLLDSKSTPWTAAEKYRTPISVPVPKITGDGNDNIFIHQRLVGGKKVSFLLNRAETEFSGTLDGAAVWIPPKGSRLLNDGESAPHPLAGCSVIMTIDNWEVKFDENHIPLNYWMPYNPEKEKQQPIDLLRRESSGGEKPMEYVSRFLYSGPVRQLRIVVDTSLFESGEWSCFVNNQLVTGFSKDVLYDCLNLSADIVPYLKTGSNPTVNKVRLVGRNLQESPYLLGDFKAEFRYAQDSLPFLTSAAQEQTLEMLEPWNLLGRAAYSGRAVYTASFEIAEGNYKLDLGRVEDAAVVWLDGVKLGTLGWTPYVHPLSHLTAGRHELRVEVYNGPGNRDRLANLPAGLIGPVKLYL